MCDEQTLTEWSTYLKDHPPVSRRAFGALSAGAGLAAVLPKVANAQAVTESDVEITREAAMAELRRVMPVVSPLAPRRPPTLRSRICSAASSRPSDPR